MRLCGRWPCIFARTSSELANLEMPASFLQDAVRALRARLSTAAAALEQSEQKAHRLEASLAQQSPARPSRQLQEAQAQLAMSEQRMEVWVHSPKALCRHPFHSSSLAQISRMAKMASQMPNQRVIIVGLSAKTKDTKTCGDFPSSKSKWSLSGIAIAARCSRSCICTSPISSPNQQGFTDTCNWADNLWHIWKPVWL